VAGGGVDKGHRPLGPLEHRYVAGPPAPGLTAVIVGLGWDPRTTSGADFDLDASALMCNASGKILSDGHFVFFNNLTSPDG